jgi:hypothetical protein
VSLNKLWWAWAGSVVLLLAGVGDWVRRDHELNEVLDHATVSERVMEETLDDLDRITQGQGRNWDEWPSGVLEDFQDRAGEGAEELLVVREQVEDETVLPWHREVDRARDRYLAHVEAWVEVFERYADERDVPQRVWSEVNATFELAEDELRGASVWWIGSNERERIDRLFAEE